MSYLTFSTTEKKKHIKFANRIRADAFISSEKQTPLLYGRGSSGTNKWNLMKAHNFFTARTTVISVSWLHTKVSQITLDHQVLPVPQCRVRPQKFMKKFRVSYVIQRFHHHIHKNAPLDPLLSLVKTVHIFAPYFTKTHLNSHPHPDLPHRIFSSSFPIKLYTKIV